MLGLVCTSQADIPGLGLCSWFWALAGPWRASWVVCVASCTEMQLCLEQPGVGGDRPTGVFFLVFS